MFRRVSYTKWSRYQLNACNMANGDPQFTLGNVIAKIDSMHEDVLEIKKDNKLREKRIRVIENKLWWYAGALAVAAGAPWVVKAVV